jgi:GNAT superfamily N-acetyltransferase
MNDLFQILPCADADAISEIATRAYRDYYLYLWNDDGRWYINRSFRPQVIAEEMQNLNAAYYMLTLNEDPIGFIKLNIDQPLIGYQHLNCIELERIYLLKSASRHGFGRQAMEFCFAFGQKRNKDLIWLKSMDTSDALHFYNRLGFEECGTFTLDFELMKREYRGMKVLMKFLS